MNGVFRDLQSRTMIGSAGLIEELWDSLSRGKGEGLMMVGWDGPSDRYKEING